VLPPCFGYTYCTSSSPPMPRNRAAL